LRAVLSRCCDLLSAGTHVARAQVMEEIIAKSKAYKALKARQREEDEAALDKVGKIGRDKTWRASQAMLSLSVFWGG
jgi:hypothetical protein